MCHKIGPIRNPCDKNMSFWMVVATAAIGGEAVVASDWRGNGEPPKSTDAKKCPAMGGAIHH